MRASFHFLVTSAILSGCVIAPSLELILEPTPQKQIPYPSTSQAPQSPSSTKSTEFSTEDSRSIESQIKKDFERTLEWDFGNRKESWQRTLEEFTLETPTDATRVTTQFVIRTQFGVTTATGSASCFSRREFYTSIFLNVASTWRTDRYRLSTIQEATPSIHPLCVGE